MLVVVGVRPDTELLVDAGATTGPRGAVVVDERMATGVPHVWAAGETALGGGARYAGSLGTQVLRVFDLVVRRTGLRQHEAIAAGRGWSPVTTQSSPDDHKAYCPGATPIAMRVMGDRDTGRLLGAQLVGRLGAEVAKRVDTFALALFHGMRVAEFDELDLSYTPPLGSPWDAVQVAAQAWVREHELPAVRRGLVRS